MSVLLYDQLFAGWDEAGRTIIPLHAHLIGDKQNTLVADSRCLKEVTKVVLIMHITPGTGVTKSYSVD